MDATFERIKRIPKFSGNPLEFQQWYQTALHELAWSGAAEVLTDPKLKEDDIKKGTMNTIANCTPTSAKLWISRLLTK